MWVWKLHKISHLQTFILKSHNIFLAQLPCKTAVFVLLSEYSEGCLFERVFHFPQRPKYMQKVVCHNPYPCAGKCQESCRVLQFMHNIFFRALPQIASMYIHDCTFKLSSYSDLFAYDKWCRLFNGLTNIYRFSPSLMLKINVTCELFPVSLV